MKISIIAVLVMAASSSFTMSATQAADDQGQSFGQAYTDAKNGVNQTASQPVSGYGQSYIDAKNGVNQTANQPASGYGQSYIDAKNDVNTVAWTKNDPTGTPANIISASTLTAAKAPVTINVAASTLTPSTPVSVTVNGVIQTVAASTLAPSVQVAVPQTVSYFAGVTPHTANGGRDSTGGRSEHGTGNGSNNAANSNSAHGLGGGNHIGGGSAQSGSRNIGHW